MDHSGGGKSVADQTYNRIDLAAEQLDVALSLFLERQSLTSALTLAGAAEEVLGKALAYGGRHNSLDWKYEAVEPTYKMLHRRPLSKRDFITSENRARNAAKHMGCAGEPTVTVDLEDAAIWMIVRACDNFERLGLPRSPRMLEFKIWFYKHVIGY
jgi:hypothetical protein